MVDECYQSYLNNRAKLVFIGKFFFVFLVNETFIKQKEGGKPSQSGIKELL